MKFGDRKESMQTIENFKDKKNTLHYNTMVDKSQYTRAQIHGLYNTRSQP